jgi:hypothetical protein
MTNTEANNKSTAYQSQQLQHQQDLQLPQQQQSTLHAAAPTPSLPPPRQLSPQPEGQQLPQDVIDIDATIIMNEYSHSPVVSNIQ